MFPPSGIVQGDEFTTPDPLTLLGLSGLSRIARIFGQPQSVAQQSPQQVMNNAQPQSNSTTDNPTPAQPSTPFTFQPDNTISKQYSQALQEMPSRADYQPGMLRRIGGALAGFAGVGPAAYSGGAALGFRNPNPALQGELQDQFDYHPYYQQLNDWAQKVKALQAGATEEDRRNSYGALRAIQGGKLDVAQSEEERKKEKDRNDLSVKQQRADAYEFEKRNPNWQAKVVGNKVIYFNPKDPSQSYDSGLDIGKMSDEDRINLQTKGRISAIKEQGSQQRQTEGVKEEDRQKDITARGNQARQTKGVPSGNAAPGAKPESATQAAARIKNKIKEAYNTHPEWQQYIDPAAGTIKPAADPNVNSQIHSFIYGQDIALPKGSAPPQTPDEEPQVTVYDLSTGKDVATIPKSNVEKLNKSKYGVRQ